MRSRNRSRFVIKRFIDGQTVYYHPGGPVQGLWEPDITRVRPYKLRAWADNKAKEKGGEVVDLNEKTPSPEQVEDRVIKLVTPLPCCILRDDLVMCGADAFGGVAHVVEGGYWELVPVCHEHAKLLVQIYAPDQVPAGSELL